MTPLGQHIFVTGFKNSFNPMEERTVFEETEVLAISPDVKVAFRVGDRVIVRKSGIIQYKGTIIVPLSDCVLWKKGTLAKPQSSIEIEINNKK